MTCDDPQFLFKEIQLFAADINEHCGTISKATEFIVQRKTVILRLYQAYSFLLTLQVMNEMITDLVDELNNEELIEKWLKNKCGRRI